MFGAADFPAWSDARPRRPPRGPGAWQAGGMADQEQDEQTGTAEEPTSAAEAEESPEEAAKRRFREALERKQKARHGGVGGGPGGSKVHGTQNRGGGKRTFRRKAGG